MIRVVDINDLGDAEALIGKTGADECSVALMARKAVFRALFIENIDNRAANFLKQDMLSLGGEVAVSRSVGGFKTGRSDALVSGTIRQLDRLLEKISTQPFGLNDVALRIRSALLNYERKKYIWLCGRQKIVIAAAPIVMGILNVTPDSFSDGGKFFNIDSALNRALEMQEQGAAVIDVGGESSRPGAKPVDTKEEIARVVPVIKKIVKRTKVLISIDTYKPEVARAALDAGADIINDITAFCHGRGAMAKLAHSYGAGVILMHMQGTPQTMQKSPAYKDVVADICDFFSSRIDFALNHDVDVEQIVIDPGIGFGKAAEHNIEIIRRMREFKSIGRPVAAGASRKSFIGKILARPDPDERLYGSIAASVCAYAGGARILRVHDVKETVEALKISQLIWN